MEMIRLGITYLKIKINEDKVILKFFDKKIQVNPKRKEITEESRIEVVSKKPKSTLIIPKKSNINRRSALSTPILKMGRNLHQLLLNLNKLLSPSPIKNPNIFQDNESYIESLLRKLNNIKISEEFNDLYSFLKINHIIFNNLF